MVLSETAEHMLAEWEARCGEAQVWDFISQYHTELGIPFPDDGSSADPGKWHTCPQLPLVAGMH